MRDLFLPRPHGGLVDFTPLGHLPPFSGPLSWFQASVPPTALQSPRLPPCRQQLFPGPCSLLVSLGARPVLQLDLDSSSAKSMRLPSLHLVQQCSGGSQDAERLAHLLPTLPAPDHTQGPACVSPLQQPCVLHLRGLASGLIAESLCSFNPQTPPHSFAGFSSALPCLCRCAGPC